MGLLVVVLIIVSACGGKALQISYYSLAPISSLEQPAEAVGSLPDLRIGVGPITLPETMKRTQIVSREGEHRFTYSEAHRWTGDIENDISRVIGENIRTLLGTELVSAFPWASVLDPTYRVLIDIQQFDGARGKNVVLAVRWGITSVKSQDILAIERSFIKEPTENKGYDDLVRAQSKALAILSREISETIMGLEEKRVQDEAAPCAKD